MNITIFILLLVLSVLGVLYGRNYGHLEMTLISFAFIFLLGISLTGATSVVGGDGGVTYKSGEFHNYTYADNATGENSDIHSIEVTEQTTTYSSAWFGSWIAIAGFFGFLGGVLGRDIYG